MRAPGLTWFRLPLFVWAHYATSLIMMLGTPVIAITLLLVAVERGAALRHLRPGARRRPGALPAPVLVLLAPGGLHHDPAGDGRDQRARRRLLAQAASSATRSSPSRSLAIAVLRLPGLGPPHVRHRPVGLRRADLLVPQLPRRDPVGDQGLQLDGDALQGLGLAATRRCSTPSASSACSRSAG